jgi:pimeloyl-ACP methyl ester carboxylesterase
LISAEIGNYVEIDGLNTFYIKTGTGTPIVVIHGGSPGACARVNWGKNLDYLASLGYTVYAFDQPGYGRTDNPEDFSLEYRVKHAQAFVEAMGLDSFILMGNSQGSYIVARIALETPEKVQKIVLVSSGTLAPRGDAASEAVSREHAERLASYAPSLENMRALTMQTLLHHENVTEELVRERYEMSIGKNREADAKRRGTPAPRPVYEDLKKLDVPVLLLWGAQDSGVTLDRSLLLFNAIPGAELHIFDRCGHWVQWDQAERFNTIVRDFLAS